MRTPNEWLDARLVDSENTIKIDSYECSRSRYILTGEHLQVTEDCVRMPAAN